MKRITYHCLAAFYCLTILPTFLPAQTPPVFKEETEMIFYGFVAPGRTHIPLTRKAKAGDFNDVVIGGGLDYFFVPRFSLGGEVGLTPYERELPPKSVAFEPPAFGIQFNGTFHFNGGNATKRFVPFASLGGGITSFAASGADTGWNYGVGTHLWGKGRFGARLEFRRIIEPTIDAYRGGKFSTIRIGLAFR